MTPTTPPADQASADQALAHSRNITYLLAALTFGYTLLLIGVDKLFPDESAVFQVIAALTTGFAGAFMTRIQAPVTRPGTPAAGAAANGASPLPVPQGIALAGAMGAIPTPAPPSPTSSTPFPKPLGMQP